MLMVMAGLLGVTIRAMDLTMEVRDHQAYHFSWLCLRWTGMFPVPMETFSGRESGGADVGGHVTVALGKLIFNILFQSLLF